MSPRTGRTLTVGPLTPALWPALEDLFGPGGASNGCWCMYWRLGAAYKRRPRARNKAALRELARRGPPPGLLALDGDLAVGWCQLTPRGDLPWLERAPHVRPPGDGESVWALSCFYIRRGYRRQGVAAVLIDAALRAAKEAGASALEAYPVDTAAPGATSNTFTGTASTFARAGFETLADRPSGRRVVRHDLRRIPRSAVAGR
jgi:GNAT superfamily N-acetyltransferase